MVLLVNVILSFEDFYLLKAINKLIERKKSIDVFFVNGIHHFHNTKSIFILFIA